VPEADSKPFWQREWESEDNNLSVCFTTAIVKPVPLLTQLSVRRQDEDSKNVLAKASASDKVN